MRAVAWSPDGMHLATASFDATAALWRVSGAGDEWECLSVVEGHESEVKGVAWSPTGELLATCGRDKSVWVWETLLGDDGGDPECLAVLQGHTQDVKVGGHRRGGGGHPCVMSAFRGGLAACPLPPWGPKPPPPPPCPPSSDHAPLAFGRRFVGTQAAPCLFPPPTTTR